MELAVPKENLEENIKGYLTVLDSWQTEVDNIRLMHHEIWKESRVYRVIKQHRAGSRVERHTRILPRGQKTDVDYKFEVVGVNVGCNGSKSQGLYWIPSESSPAYGKIFATPAYKSELSAEDHFNEIFNEDAFRWDTQQNAYLLVPDTFKENVVKVSGFAYLQKTQSLVKSPSLPGDGAVNEYDIVPCLQMSEWPECVLPWIRRGDKKSAILDTPWRQAIRDLPVYIVATGNPSSIEYGSEFRLSFSLIEVQCFRTMPEYAHQLYGFSKYIFKSSVEPFDLLDSYHLKTLFLWTLEHMTVEELNICPPLQFVKNLFTTVQNCVTKEEIKHFFVDGCNIFPFHKTNLATKQALYREFFKDINKKIEEIALSLLKTDLKIPDEGDVNDFQESLKLFGQPRQMQEYVDAYHTRLLSVTTFSLYENKEQGTLSPAVTRIKEVFECYTEFDRHIPRIIPMVNATLRRLVDDVWIPFVPVQIATGDEEVSASVHEAFEAYLRDNHEKAKHLLYEVGLPKNLPQNGGFGVSITSYHTAFNLDGPLKFVIRTLEEKSKNGKCPRFYVDPVILGLHMLIQMDSGNVASMLGKMEDITKLLPDHVPYKGKLSYKFTAVYLIHGYKCWCQLSDTGYKLSIPDIYSMDYFDNMFPTNFEMQ